MRKLIVIFFLVFLITGCSEKYTPKPRGYQRIDFPVKKYMYLDEKFPYGFEIPVYSKILPDDRNPDKPFWINVTIPENKAEIHISFYNFNKISESSRKQLSGFIEESRELAYKHSFKADAIDERLFINHEKKVYGIVYKISGNAASPIQFYLTDSTRNFLRGALYIRSKPDIDSLQPVIQFLETDVIHLIETTFWK